MPEPHPYRPPGPGAPFKPPTIVGPPANTGVAEDAAGEKFNINVVDGDDYKTSPDDAQRALKELVEGAVGAADLEGVDMKDATVEGFRDGITLMPHQIQGRAWMKERETGKKCGGILADDVSLDWRGLNEWRRLFLLIDGSRQNDSDFDSCGRGKAYQGRQGGGVHWRDVDYLSRRAYCAVGV
jgi:hypothetical protein